MVIRKFPPLGVALLLPLGGSCVLFAGFRVGRAGWLARVSAFATRDPGAVAVGHASESGVSGQPSIRPASHFAGEVQPELLPVATDSQPCTRQYSSKSSRPGVPCLPPAQLYPYNRHTPWRRQLGGRIVSAVTPNTTEAECGGFELFGDSTWCRRAMLRSSAEGALGLSYGIEQRDLWSEKMSNVFHLPTRLYDCFIPPEISIPISGRAPNGTLSCKHRDDHCYEMPYQAWRTCLGPEARTVSGRQYETLASHLEGRGPLSTFVKIDTEGTEWSVLEQLLGSEEDLARVATLEMEVHFSYLPEAETPEALGMPEQQRLERRVEVMERLLRRFAVIGSTLEVYREDWRPETECAGSTCSEPPVHIGSMSVDQFAVSYVNRDLLAVMASLEQAPSDVRAAPPPPQPAPHQPCRDRQDYCGSLAECYQDCQDAGEVGSCSEQVFCCPSVNSASFALHRYSDQMVHATKFFMCHGTGSACVDRCNSQLVPVAEGDAR